MHIHQHGPHLSDEGVYRSTAIGVEFPCLVGYLVSDGEVA
jgi:hypothetical protein